MGRRVMQFGNEFGGGRVVGSVRNLGGIYYSLIRCGLEG